MARPTAVPIEIEIELNGRIYKGAYTIDATGEMIVVAYGGKSKILDLRSSAPETLARLTLRDLVTGT